MNMFTQLKQISKFGVFILGTSVMLINQAAANDAFKGDALYEQQHFEQARIEYLAAAKVGSPHVYYQLGTMHYKGQGTEANTLSALLWFSLAAEYQYNDAENIVAQIMQNIDKQKKPDVESLINDFKQIYGKQQISNKYLTANLDKKITFGGEGTHDTENDATDQLFGVTSSSKLSDDQFDEFYTVDSFENVDPFADLMDEYEFEDLNENEDQLIQNAPMKKNPLDLPFLATIDYDVAPDGSIRNIDKVYGEGRAGNINTAMYNYSLITLAKPTFEGKRVNFINRGHIGIHRYDLMQIRGKHKDIHRWVRRSLKKLTESNTPQDNYKRAMMLLYYPWYPREEGLAESLLKNLAEQGHVYSQYEYGSYLYREQIAPAEAIKWLSLASQFGLAKAQYRLAKILQESPWVVNDEKKSLFWYEAAAQKGHSTALLKSAELKILANDESLRNQAEAIDILSNIEPTQNKNPEYSYLVAVSHLRGEFRDFQKVVKYLRKAIYRGQTLNWDVSKWEEQLRKWTTGIVTIND